MRRASGIASLRPLEGHTGLQSHALDNGHRDLVWGVDAQHLPVGSTCAWSAVAFQRRGLPAVLQPSRRRRTIPAAATSDAASWRNSANSRFRQGAGRRPHQTAAGRCHRARPAGRAWASTAIPAERANDAKSSSGRFTLVPAERRKASECTIASTVRAIWSGLRRCSVQALTAAATARHRACPTPGDDRAFRRHTARSRDDRPPDRAHAGHRPRVTGRIELGGENALLIVVVPVLDVDELAGHRQAAAGADAGAILDRPAGERPGGLVDVLVDIALRPAVERAGHVAPAVVERIEVGRPAERMELEQLARVVLVGRAAARGPVVEVDLHGGALGHGLSISRKLPSAWRRITSVRRSATPPR